MSLSFRQPPRLPGPILETDYANPQRRPLDRRADWPKRLVGGKTFLSLGANKYEWVSIHDSASQYDLTLTGLSGTVISPELSKSDDPFLHPFGYDFEFYVAPDERYFELVAPRQTDDSYVDARLTANTDFDLDVPGVIGMECDSWLVPAQFRRAVKEGDRVALWGRWIVDAGHDDFHTEIHPPLLMATAQKGPSRQQLNTRGFKSDATTVQIITRPFLVDQEFGDGGLFEHLVKELAKVQVFLSTQVEAKPRLLDVPFKGLQILTFKVRPPTPRINARDRLIVEFSLTRRDDSVAIQVLKGNDDESVRVVVVFNEAGYVPPPKPNATDYTVTLSQIEAMNPDAGSVYRDIIFADILASPLAGLILSRGIKTRRYAAPAAPVAGPVTRVPLADLRPVNIPVDVSQAFPLSGTVKLEWERYAPIQQGPVAQGSVARSRRRSTARSGAKTRKRAPRART